jgi:PAS domain S-box-containing protein
VQHREFDAVTRRAGAKRHRYLAGGVGAAAAAIDGLLERRAPDVSRRLTPRERRVEGVMAALFAATAGAMLVIAAPPLPDPGAAVLLVVTYALVARVRFQVGSGLVRPTQLVLVPMLFLVPAPYAPIMVAAASILSELPEMAARRAHPERLLVATADSWHVIGPAVVVALLAPHDPIEAPWTVYLLALAAQFAVDFAASTTREWFGAGIRPAELAPVLAIIYVVDALLAPIGFLALLATDVHPQAYLLAVAPGALLALIARERRKRIEQELALGRAYRRSTRLLGAHAEDLRREAGLLEHALDHVGGPGVPTVDRDALERLVLFTTVDAIGADCGRLISLPPAGPAVTRAVLGETERHAGALSAAEAALISGPAPRQVMVGDVAALAIPLGSCPRSGECLTIGRLGGPYSAAERELLEHLAAQAAVSLENLRLRELMRKTEEELRAILEGVADGVTAEVGGRFVYVNTAAAGLLGYDDRQEPLDVPIADIVERLQVTHESGEPVRAGRLPGTRTLAGERPEPLVLRYRLPETGEPRCARVKATPVHDERGGVRLAISVIEDITEIKQAEEAQRFLAESSRLLAGSLDGEDTLAALARLAVPRLADWCTVHLADDRGLRCVAVEHTDPAKEALVEALEREYPSTAGDDHGAGRVARTGRAELHTEVTDQDLAATARDDRHLELLRSLGMVSALAVPMLAHDHVVGVITIVSDGSGRRFGPLDLSLAEDLGLRAGTAVENARLYRTRSAIARTLQASLLPPVLPRIPRLETAALYRPAGEGHDVGGDFYDLFSTGKDQWFVVIGDVCGKGAGAAAVTALARYTIRAAVVRRRSPAGILNWLNEAMLRQLAEQARFATIVCARLDLDRHGVTATVAIGGHPCPRVLRDTGLVEELGVPGTVLGVVPEINVEDRPTRLARGDALVLYTDGLTEAGAPRSVWSPKQLDAAVGAARHQPAQGIVDHLMRAAVDEAGGALRDDLALLALRAL